MNLKTTLWIYAGGQGSGCHGPNCGRPRVTLESRTGFPKPSLEAYHIKDPQGKVLGTVAVKQHGEDLEIGWISGTVNPKTETFNNLGMEVIRAVFSALKELYPTAKRIIGERISGIHQRVGKQHTQVAWA